MPKQTAQGTQERYARVLALLPKHNFQIAKAAREAGYCRSYADGKLQERLSHNVWFQRESKRLRDENLEIQTNLVKALDAKLSRILDTCELPDGQRVPPTVYKGFVELRYKRLGALGDVGSRQPATDTAPITPEQRETARKEARKRLESQGRPA